MSVTASGTDILVNGVPVQLRGINIYYTGGGALTDAGAQSVLETFPGITAIRVNCFGSTAGASSYPDPAAMAPYVNALTAAGVVVLIEAHDYPTCLTGANLTKATDFYAACAAQFNANPLVIYGTQNEPDLSQVNGGDGGWGAVVAQINAVYNALRNAGYTGYISICAAGGYDADGFTAADFTGFTNVGWELHYYAWEDGNNTNETVAVNELATRAGALSAVCNWPILIGEYGPSSGAIVGDDIGGDQITQAVQSSSYSSTAWAWTSGNADLPLLLNSTSGDASQGLTSNFGVPTAAFIAAGQPLPSSGGGGGTVVAPFISPGSGSFVIGADTYTLSAAGEFMQNGTAIPGGHGTALMASLGGVAYAQDGTSKDWYTFDGVSAFTPVVVSASGTLVTDTLGFIVMDAKTIVTMTGIGGQIAFNGTVDAITQHVYLLLFENGVLTQKVTQTGQASTLLGASITYGPDDTTNWTPDLNGFTTAMGQAPVVFNEFVDSGSDWANFDTQGQWTAAEIVKGAPSPAIPVVALPMAVSADTDADTAFQAIAAGTHDAAINDVFNAYKTNGYSTIYIRPGWEFNASWFKWAVTSANKAHFVAAFQHIATLAHSFVGMTIKVIFEPNYNSPYDSAMYPGNSYVDVIGIDGVGAGSGGPPNTEAADLGGSTWSFALAAQLAVANSKPVCCDELIDAVTDVPSFAAAIASAWAAAPGLVVDHFSILNDPSQTMFSGDAAASAAWRQCFANVATGMVWYSYNGTPGSWTQLTKDPRMPTTVAPGAPAAPTATSTVTINLSWGGVSGTPTPTYTVQYRVTGVNDWTNGPSGLSVLNAVITIPGGSSYDFRIAAVNSAGTTYGAVKQLMA